MKKLTIVIAAVFMLLTPMKELNAQLSQGRTIVDGYLGYSFAQSLSRTLFDDLITYNSERIRYSGLFPIGMRFEHMIADRVGMGMEVNYRSNILDFYEVQSSTLVEHTYRYEDHQFRLMGRLNYHFVNDENVDIYGGIGAGYRHVRRKAETTDTTTDLDWIDEIFPPVTFRLSLGFRYFFVPNMGVNFEMGIGGGTFFNGGLSYTF